MKVWFENWDCLTNLNRGEKIAGWKPRFNFTPEKINFILRSVSAWISWKTSHVINLWVNMNVYLDVQRSIQSEDQQASSSYDILNNPELYRLMIDFKIIIQHWKSDFSNFFMKHGPSPAISKIWSSIFVLSWLPVIGIISFRMRHFHGFISSIEV